MNGGAVAVRWGRWARAAALLGALSLTAEQGRAQNAQPFFYSDDAALMSGAMVAVPGDPGAVIYNPAGLGALRRGRVSLSGSVVGVRLRSLPGALTTRVGEAESSLDFDTTDLVSSPTGITAAFSLHPKVTLGLGLYTTARDLGSQIDDETGVPVGGGATLSQRVDLQYDRTKYQAGAALGYAPVPSVRFGLGAFVIYGTDDVFAQYAVALATSADTGAFETVTGRVSTSAWGLLPTAGLQVDLAPSVHVGLFVSAPELMLTSTSEGAVIATGATNLGDSSIVSFAIEHSEDTSEGVEALAPARLGIGVALDPSPNIRVSLEGEVATDMTNESLGLTRTWTGNGRLGARFAVTPELALGGGFFTDLANHPRAGSLGATRLDYLGTTFGGSLLTPLSVGDDKSPDALVLSTTLGVRYAVGFGEGTTLRFDGDTTREGATDIVAHDVMPYTGSAILF